MSIHCVPMSIILIGMATNRLEILLKMVEFHRYWTYIAWK